MSLVIMGITEVAIWISYRDTTCTDYRKEGKYITAVVQHMINGPRGNIQHSFLDESRTHAWSSTSGQAFTFFSPSTPSRACPMLIPTVVFAETFHTTPVPSPLTGPLHLPVFVHVSACASNARYSLSSNPMHCSPMHAAFSAPAAYSCPVS